MKSNDHRTLDEIRADDIDQLDQAFKASKLFEFQSRKEAYRFQGECVQKALERLGMPESARMHANMIDRLMETKGIRVEKRPYHGPADDPDDGWRTGIYVYRMINEVDHDELAFFVSNVRSRNRISLVDLFGNICATEYAVRTNVTLDTPKIFSFAATVTKPSNTMGRVIVPS